MNLQKKKIIVTGGTGFIGSHLVEELVKSGATVHVIDIMCDPRSYFKRQSLDKKTELHLIDIAKRSKIKKLFTNLQPDFVFHLAAEAIVNTSYKNPFRTFETNVMGTVSILEAARLIKDLKGIIVASSDKAYGKTKEAYTEESPLKGDHPYDVSKSCTDLIAQTYHKTYHLPIVVTRFGNVYGEGDLHLDRIIPGICEAIVRGNELSIRSNGTFVRDYVYVKDVVKGYLTLYEKINDIHGHAFNFSSNDTFSVIDLIKKSEEILKKKIEYTILNIAKNEIPYQHLDDTKVRKLGWQPNYSLESTLPNIVKWYERLL